MFLLETLHSKVSQALALHTVSEYWNENLKEDQLVPEFEDIVLKRNISAVIFTVGNFVCSYSVIFTSSSHANIIFEHNSMNLMQTFRLVST